MNYVNQPLESAPDLKTIKSQLYGGTARLVDVREFDEHAQLPVAGALCLPLSILSQLTSAEPLAGYLPSDRVVYVHCAHGIRSITGAAILCQFGYHAIALPYDVEELLDAGLGNNQA